MSSLTGEYKVVRAFQQEILPIPNKPSRPSVLEAEVYTLGTGHWRSLGPIPVTYGLDIFQEFNGPFLNNHCHWIVRDVEGDHEKIGTFDLENETFQLFPSPPESVKENWFPHRRLAIVKGCLCKLRTYYSELTIWMMKEYGINNSWHKEVVIRRGISVDLEWPLYKPIHLIAGLKDGSILIVFKNKMCVFDPRSEMFEDTKMFEPNLSGQGYRPSFLKLQHFKAKSPANRANDGRGQRKSMAEFLPNIKLIDSSMEDLPAELTTDILSRLTVKTIIHCRCVCKRWRNLVLDSSFVNLHLSRSPTPTGFIIHHNPRTCANPGILEWVEIEDKVDRHHLHYDRLLSLDLRNRAPIQQYTKMHQVGSVNGLICLWEYGHKVDNTYVCNPITREYMILPRQRYQRDRFPGVIYGFGVSSQMGEYKVVRAFQAKTFVQNGDKCAGQLSVLEAEVYTLGTGQWRSLHSVPVTYLLNTFNKFCGQFLNNHCHWIVADNEICTFDLDNETFQLLPSPPSVKKYWFHRQSLAILKGCLCILSTYDSKLTIWVMKEYGIKNSWHKQVVNQTIQGPLYEAIHLIMGLKDGSFLILFENIVCVFDPRRKTIEDTKFFKLPLSGWAYSPSFLKLRSFESEM
ncbi:hypothetical protein OSB04_un000224, partial [Centaurea solstitialis]